MLDICGLQVYRDSRLLCYDLAVPQGEILALQGVSGVGKSTLLDCIAGFLVPYKGDIYWQGESLLASAADRRPVSYLFQEHNLFEHISVKHNFMLGAAKSILWEQVVMGAEKLQVIDQLHKMPTELSGGQRQRIALIRTMLRPEPIVLLDEPFAELDELTRQLAGDWVRDVAKLANKTLLVVTHQAEDVTRVSDRCVHL